MKFSYEALPSYNCKVLFHISYAFKFLTKTRHTNYTKLKCLRNILDLQYQVTLSLPVSEEADWVGNWVAFFLQTSEKKHVWIAESLVNCSSPRECLKYTSKQTRGTRVQLTILRSTKSSLLSGQRILPMRCPRNPRFRHFPFFVPCGRHVSGWSSSKTVCFNNG